MQVAVLQLQQALFDAWAHAICVAPDVMNCMGSIIGSLPVETVHMQ